MGRLPAWSNKMCFVSQDILVWAISSSWGYLCAAITYQARNPAWHTAIPSGKCPHLLYAGIIGYALVELGLPAPVTVGVGGVLGIIGWAAGVH